MDLISRKFEFERATKRMYRFKEVSETPVFGVLYVKKEVFGVDVPNTITVTVQKE